MKHHGVHGQSHCGHGHGREFGLGRSGWLWFPLWILFASSTIAQDSQEAGDAANAEAAGSESTSPKVHRVEAEPLSVTVTVDGVFESTSASEIKADTESWSALVIQKVVPEGTRVKQGDPVIWFETDEIDKKLRESKYDLQLAELGLKDARLELTVLEKTVPLEKQQAERSRRNAQDDLTYFLEVDREQREKSARFSLKMAEYSLEYAQEELKQLEQMYKEDELTEESEEIILKRAQRSVESSQFSLESNRLRTQRTLSTTLPREQEQLRDAARRQELEYQKAMVELPRDLERKRIEVAKLEFTHQKTQEDHDQLVEDRKRMILRAPADGIVYHGRSIRGEWSSASGSSNRELKPGASANADHVLMTIVTPGALQIHATLKEEQLGKVSKGVSGLATPKAFPDRRLRVQVASVSLVPQATDKFDCVIQLHPRAALDSLMPGMTCSVELTPYEHASALTVPERAVFTENGRQFYVYVLRDGKPVKQIIERGHKSGETREVLKGLQVGDDVLLEKP